MQNNIRTITTTAKDLEIHSIVKLNESPQDPCQVMASHLFWAGHCEETQECNVAIVVEFGSLAFATISRTLDAEKMWNISTGIAKAQVLLCWYL